MSAQVFEDKSVEAALEQAASALGVPVEELEHELVDEQASDFWGLGNTVYSVRAWRRGSDPAAVDSEGGDEAADVAVASPPEPEEGTAASEGIPVQPAASSAEPAEDSPAGDSGPTGGDPVAEQTADADQATADVETGSEVTEANDPAPVEGVLPAFFRSADDAPTDEASTEDASTEDEDAATEDAPVDDAQAEVLAEAEVVATSPEGASGDRSAARGSAPEEVGGPDGGGDVSDEATDLLDTIFETMDFDCEAEARLDGETLQIAITGDDNQYLLDGRGRGLSALELILNHAFRHRPDRAHRRVRVDAGDFRSQRDDEIRDMAYQVAHQAKETDSPQQTGPLNPYERRIVHLTLAEDPKVKTRSVGNGFQKAVNVIPTQGGRRH
ncbi:MAG TPA: Jag N-terminal domain-containing protein [Acidobacteriota bacterium]|nr:Jag N-terminal domain-containing protein [Acidobacteriota bacterium]